MMILLGEKECLRRKLVSRLMFVLFLGLVVFSVNAETLALRGGAKISGKLVRKDSKSVFIDIGFTILQVPNKEVLKIFTEEKGKKKESSENKKYIYTEKNMKPASISEAVERCSPSVVIVKRNSGGLGSGFFINKEGFIVTNFHVIKNERSFTVIQFVKDKHETRRVKYNKVRIVASDPLHDLAVLKLEEKKEKFIPVVFSPADTAKVGDTVFAIGTPLGLERTVTEGILSHKSRMFNGLMFLQVDAPINSGNSGGPLFNANGEVIGVNNMGVVKSIGEGLNFAIPMRDVKFLLEHLEAYAFDESNPETGFVYSAPPGKTKNKNSKSENKKSKTEK